ncbi:hypothetical protein HYFRA_00008316 [Hymenoscyphus fraxineus]|uniref:Uncharacterized protein n=1 Tax=Hymenoscyphus fraxineus TaxID=746836 RepID=A0A9N9KR69_9HELO|nr:hypothetical protein HYFRA_00008316 [Hymenoscyphus fraxineus]
MFPTSLSFVSSSSASSLDVSGSPMPFFLESVQSGQSVRIDKEPQLPLNSALAGRGSGSGSVESSCEGIIQLCDSYCAPYRSSIAAKEANYQRSGGTAPAALNWQFSRVSGNPQLSVSLFPDSDLSFLAV